MWEVYFYKEVCWFVHWSSYIIVDYVSAYIMYMYMYVYGCDYTTVTLKYNSA